MPRNRREGRRSRPICLAPASKEGLVCGFASRGQPMLKTGAPPALRSHARSRISSEKAREGRRLSLHPVATTVSNSPPCATEFSCRLRRSHSRRQAPPRLTFRARHTPVRSILRSIVFPLFMHSSRILEVYEARDGSVACLPSRESRLHSRGAVGRPLQRKRHSMFHLTTTLWPV